MNSQTKHIMVDIIPSEMRLSLAYRITQGIVSTFFLYNAVKQLPLVEVALVTNLMPLFTAFFGCLFLGERLNQFEIFVLIVSFTGVVIMILGGKKQIQPE